MRAMFLAESVVRVLDPEFQLLETLQAKGPEVLKTAMAQSDLSGSLDRLRYEALIAAQNLPTPLGLLPRKLAPIAKA